MKKFVLSAAAAVAFTLFAAPASACDRYSSANCWNARDEAANPDYQRAIRSRFDGGGYDSYDYPVMCCVDLNTVRRNTARRGGDWYKACPNGDPGIPIKTPCPGTSSYTAPQPNRNPNADGNVGTYTGTSVQSYIDNGYLVTVTTQPNGDQLIHREPVRQ